MLICLPGLPGLPSSFIWLAFSIEAMFYGAYHLKGRFVALRPSPCRPGERLCVGEMDFVALKSTGQFCDLVECGWVFATTENFCLVEPFQYRYHLGFPLFLRVRSRSPVSYCRSWLELQDAKHLWDHSFSFFTEASVLLCYVICDRMIPWVWVWT